ncbi:hypothetical protein CAP35_03730 [Chitinophagaceae bacterium IBVUCB1]|nr:hypothetical protein CAP35_03730 [Chitinophagaceae bacterium IBVUCB1]
MQESIEPMFADSRQTSSINLEKLVSRVADYWPSILISVLVALLFAFGYLRYVTPQYLVKARVLVKNEKTQAANGALLEELGMTPAASNVENEVEIFKSRLLMQQVVEDMDLHIQYYIPGAVKNTNLYKDIPFRLKPISADSSIRSYSEYTITKNGDKLIIENGGKAITAAIGDTVVLSQGRFVIVANTNVYKDVNEFLVTISPVESLVDSYLGSLIVEMVNRQVNIINLSVRDVIAARGEDVLKKLIEVYQQSNISDKNEIANGTISFIEDRLGFVTTELTDVEKLIEEFKKANKLTDIEAQSRLLLDNTGTNLQELTQKEIQLRVLESLEKYLQDNNNMRRIMPATLIGEDITLVSIVSDYNNLQLQRQKLMLTYTENSPQIRNIDVQLEDLRLGMKNYISSLRRGYQVTVNELRARAGMIAGDIKQVPTKEREYLEFSRQQHIKQELYLFLLKKREETAITKSATVSNLKIVDPPRNAGAPVFPKTSRIYLMAFVIGLAIPTVRIVLKELFNNRVSSKSDVETGTSMPVLAEIASAQENQTIVVRKESKTVVAEQFRALRTNIQFMLTNEDEKVILITSSMSGEGKSFVSLNLASAIALSGKKVLLLELDLRKPKIAQHLNINKDSGFTNYAIGKADTKSIILSSGVTDGFDVIPSGPIPPNPAELIMLPKTKQLIDQLKPLYDYIILDTAPVGLVTDAQLLSPYADATIYILRQGYTFKQQLIAADMLYKSGKMKRMGLVVNDVEMKRGSEYAYGKYGSGYYDDEITTSRFKVNKFIKRK